MKSYFRFTGKYIYLEASGKKPKQTAKLNSKELAGKTCLKFYYYMYGQDVAELRVETWDQETNSTNVVWSKAGDQGNEWKTESLQLTGANYKVRICSFLRSYMSIKIQCGIAPHLDVLGPLSG